jgi:NAD(P)-dependent dehydrogenase (short-subunit alcohol dehydrogenase family)
MKRGLRRATGSDLTGRTCLVTGGAQGIGWSLSLLFAEHGARVHACDVSTVNLDRAAHNLVNHPYAAAVNLHHLDVTDRKAFEQWITKVHAETGRIDVLVNNAAFIRWTTVEQMSVEDAEQSMLTGFNAMVYGVKAVLPLMRANGGGHVVNMGSSAGRLLVKGPSAAYAGAKAAIEAYTEILRIELHGTPIHITLVRPGVVTGTQFFGRHVMSRQLPRLVDFLPAATPDQVATAVVRAISEHRYTVDVPSYLPALYRVYDLSPALFRRLAELGGPAQRDYATASVPLQGE